MIKNIFNIPPAGQPEVDPSTEIIAPGGFAAILARAGVGKTALLVQIAINSMLWGKTSCTFPRPTRWTRLTCGTGKCFSG